LQVLRALAAISAFSRPSALSSRAVPALQLNPTWSASMERLSFAFARAINISATANDERRSTMTKVLFVLTGSGEWALKDGSTHAGGFWSPEFVYPHHAFEEAGWDIATLSNREWERIAVAA